MLIYVDKKKEKQRKIKIFCLILFAIIFVCLNILSYHSRRHHEQTNLSSYHKITHQNPWYNNTLPIHSFSNKKTSNINIIILPQTINKEMALTLANNFMQLPQQNYILTITDEVNNSDFLRQLFEITKPTFSSEEPIFEIILTSDFTRVQEAIKNLKLYPKTLNYGKISKNPIPEVLNNLLNNYYQPQIEAKTDIEKEQKALAEFAEENKDTSPQFSKQATFLKNARLCLQTKETINCQTRPETSLLLNIKKALHAFPRNIKPQALLLWTSNEKINPSELQHLNNDEGLYFRFNQREIYLLPQELNSLTIEKEPLAILKEKIGLNPEYTSPQMELYRFKITEVILDE